MKVKISKGNMKVGATPNISLTPGRSCSAIACQTCLKEGCYACKAYKQYPATRAAWDSNTELALNDLDTMESELNAYFSKANTPRFFRIHVGGDFITREYAEMWARVAKAAPGTKFLAFTKQWDNIRGVDFPDNVSIVLSGWTGTTIPSDLLAIYPAAFCVEPGEKEPDGAMECPGACEACGACWFLRDTGKNVFFHKH